MQCQNEIVQTVDQFFKHQYYKQAEAFASFKKLKYELILRMETEKKGRDRPVNKFVLVSHAANLFAFLQFPLRACAFHEMMLEGRQVKPWFDLDGFDVAITNDEMMATFSKCWLEFCTSVLQIEATDDDLCWAECTRKDDEGFVTKNSLHMTMQRYVAENNEVHMKTIAKRFVEFIGLECHVDGDHVIEALLFPGVIDFAVYNKNSSIRVVGSPKIGDYRSPIRMVDDDVPVRKMYVSCFFTGQEKLLPVIAGPTPIASGVSDQLLLGVMQEVLDMPSAVIKSTHPLDEFYTSVVVQGYTICHRGDTTHSKDEDVYFKVSAFDPVVRQSCHSQRCAGHDAFELARTHSKGACAAITKKKTYDNLTSHEYLEACEAVIDTMTTTSEAKADAPPKPLTAKEKAKALKPWYDVLVVHYYNRFFGVIMREAKALIGIDSLQGKRWVVVPSEFKQQYAGRGIDQWLKSPLQKTYQYYGYAPYSDEMIEMGCCAPPYTERKCKNRDFRTDDAMHNITDHEHRAPDLELTDDDFNLFTGLGITHKQAYEYKVDDPMQIRRECAPFLVHVIKVWCGGDRKQAFRVIQWLAINYLQPWRKIGTALVLHSGKGTGKGIILAKMAELLGELYWQINTMDPIVGGYQPEQLMRCGLLFADECVWSGDPRVANRVKGMITEEHSNCNVKFRPSKSYRSCMNMVIASNNDRAVELTADNRRFQMLAMKEKEFECPEDKAIYFQMVADVPAVALAAFFMRCVCLCEFVDGEIFGAAGEQVQDGLLTSSPFDSWWHDLIAGESEFDLYSQDRVPLQCLRQLYETYARGKHARTFPTVGTFGKALKKRLGMLPGDRWVRTARNNEGNRIAALLVQSKEDVQKAFNEYTGQEFFKFNL